MDETQSKENGHELSHLLETTHPLLQSFRRGCPGTYKHSQTLASIIEAVAMELGLDIEAMKVRAMYHDIGKLVSPEYFSENQGKDNAHDDMDPLVSAQVITRHVADSVLMLVQDGNFPPEIIDSISRHHGNSVLKYFWKKAGNPDVDDGFRYKSQRPQTVGDAILMITDCAEASTRSLSQGGKLDDVSKHVEQILQDLMNEGQLDDVTMKLGDLARIKAVLKSELGGLYQKRVDYEAKEDKTTKEEQ